MDYILDEQLNKYEVFDLSKLTLKVNEDYSYQYQPVTFKLNEKIDLLNVFLIYSDLCKAKVNCEKISVIKHGDSYLYDLEINFFEIIED